MINAVVLLFRGSFQFRAATEPDNPTTKSPFCHSVIADVFRRPGGYAGDSPAYSDLQNTGNGGTFNYGEVFFDGKVRLSSPVAIRTFPMDSWEDTRVVYAWEWMDTGKIEDPIIKSGLKRALDPVWGQVVSFGRDVKFWDPRRGGAQPTESGDPTHEQMLDFHLSIGDTLLTAEPVVVPSMSEVQPVDVWRDEYLNRKSQLAKNTGIKPDVRWEHLQHPGLMRNAARMMFGFYGKYFNVALKDVRVTSKQGVLNDMGKPADFDWTLDVLFGRYDPDALCGRVVGRLEAMRRKLKKKPDLGDFERDKFDFIGLAK